MNTEEFQAIVLAQPNTESQLTVARELLFSAVKGSPQDDPDAQRRQRVRAFLQFKEYFLSLYRVPIPYDIPDRVEAARERVKLGETLTEAWLALAKEAREMDAESLVRRDYRDLDRGLPPYRDRKRESLDLLYIADRSEPLKDGVRFDCEQVMPYVDAARSKKAREAAVDRWVEWGRIEQAHLRGPDEVSLLGQRGLFARRPIPAGTCVGVYGGQLLDDVDLFLASVSDYFFAVASAAGSCTINGENLLSLANTLMSKQEGEEDVVHPETGYELIGVAFDAHLTGGWRIGLPSFFTCRDVAAGEELRWNYRLRKVMPTIAPAEAKHTESSLVDK